MVIEITFLFVYWVSHNTSTSHLLESLSQSAEAELTYLSESEAVLISQRLQVSEQSLGAYGRRAAEVLTSPCEIAEEEVGRYVFSPGGALYSAYDNGGAALFYSGIAEIGEEQLTKVWCSHRMDSVMKAIVEASDLIEQIYINTHDSMNRIYPYFDVMDQFAESIDIPSFNFYYEADQQHNPERKNVWTDVYLDPAGLGWMISAISPIYDGDFLEGVAGVDIPIGDVH